MTQSHPFTRRTAALALLVLLALFISACGTMSGTWPGISASDDAIYVAHGERVVALDPSNGQRLWEYPDGDNRDTTFSAIPVEQDGTVYVGDYKGRVHAINAENGQRIWLYEPEIERLIGPIALEAADRVLSGVAVSEDRVFTGLGSRNVIALDRETGALDWTFETEHGVWATPLYLPANGSGHDEPTLYAVSLDHHLYALDPETGDRRWQIDLGAAAPGNMTYDEVRNRIYVGTFLSELLAIDLGTQSIVARYQTEGWLWDNPALADDMLYFGDLKGFVYAVEITDDGFRQVWKQPVAEDAVRGTPVVTASRVIVGSRDKTVYALNRSDGSLSWRVDTRSPVLTDVILASQGGDDAQNERVVFGTTDNDALLVALSSASGEVDWRYANDD